MLAKKKLTNTFGADIRKMRLGDGYRLRQFARMVDISPTYLSRMERGELPPPSTEVIKNIATALRLDPEIACMRAGRMPSWIKELLQSDQAIACAKALREIKNGVEKC